MIRLGRKLENPYTVQNMREAYANLVSQGVLKSGLVIDATHLYIRVLPASEQEMIDFENHLLQYISEHDLELLEESISGHFFSYPLDYELIEGGYHFYDPQLPPGGITWQYTVVPVNFNLPPVQHEILNELFLKCNFALAEKSSRGFDHHSWQLLETEALKLAGDPYAELQYQPTLKSTAASWTPSGRITVWDDVLRSSIPLQGARVRARRWFRTLVGITDTNGHFVMGGTFRRPANYSIIWERRDWDIRSGIWGQAYFNGPQITGAWNLDLDINSEKSLRFATIHRALIRYFYSGDRLGLKSPYYAPPLRSRLKVGYFHREQAGCNFLGWGIPYANWATLPHIAVYGKSCSVGWLSTDTIFGITINELAHISHWDLLGHKRWDGLTGIPIVGYFAELWGNPDTRIIPESWSDFVEWGLTNLEYHRLGQQFNHEAATNHNHVFGMQRWTSLDDRHYTPLFIDLVDNINQRLFRDGRGHLRPNDNVSGFTFCVLEQKVLRYTFYGLNCLRERLKLHKPAGVTDAQIDELIDFYANL